jgi:acyl carrier protein
VTVAVVQADVARREDVARVLAGLPAPLAGIFHLAGVLDDGVLQQQDARRLAAVLAPKVDGAWHLHELSAGLPLERFVLFSSVASVLGPPGQGTYAGANAFLDALAHHRRQRGLPAQSINWGPWAEAGMAAGHAGRMAARGVGAWTQADGLERLHDVLLGAGAQVAAIDLEPATWLAATPQLASWPFLAALVPAGRAVVSEPAGGWREHVIAAAPSERGRAMERLLVELVATVLNQPAAAIDPLVPLAELGLDSLLGLELRSRLGLATGLELPATLAWTYPTVAALAAFLAAQLIPAEAPAPAPAAPAAERPLSAAEAEALLLAELESLEALKEAWS